MTLSCGSRELSTAQVETFTVGTASKRSAVHTSQGRTKTEEERELGEEEGTEGGKNKMKRKVRPPGDHLQNAAGLILQLWVQNFVRYHELQRAKT